MEVPEAVRFVHPGVGGTALPSAMYVRDLPATLMGAALGLLSRSGPSDPEVLRRMAGAAPHRGAEARTLALGAAVVGATSAGSAESDVAREGRYAAAFSGHLDNLEELASQLERAGGPPGARTPAAILARAFAAWGEATPTRLRGPFAAAVTDGERLWAFRDHVGFHPLHYRDAREGTWVAAQPRQVVAGAGMPYRPDPETVQLIFYGRLEDEASRSAVADVERLPPGHLLAANAAGARRTRYWHPERLLETARLGADEVPERFHALMERAVARSLRGGDVVSLSGGVDSPAVAAYAAPLHRERTGEPLPALTSVFPDFPSVDESRYVRALAGELGLELHTFVPTSRPTDDLEKWIRLFDGPVPVVSLAEAFEYLERARSLGFRNVLRGDMAEYVFDFRRYTLTHLVARGRWAAAARHVQARRRQGVGVAKLAEEVAKAVLPPAVRSATRALHAGRPDARVPPWLDRTQVRSPPVLPGRRLWREDQLAAFRGAALSFEADDGIQAATGVSIRRPFADVDLWEFFLGLPAEVKFPRPERKTLVRSLLRGKVPDIVLDRRDQTVFDEFIQARIDYEALERHLLASEGFRMPGVDYARLADRLAGRDLDIPEFMWAKDLAAAHAFMSQW